MLGGGVRRRVASAVLGVVALLGASCGSRVDAPDVAASVAGDRATTPSTTDPTGTPPVIGTQRVACSPGDGTPVSPAPGAYPDDTKGVTADSIHIALITDKAGLVKLPTKGIEESALALVEMCNRAGGINGRRLELTVYDSAISRHAEATKQVCDDDVFAIVMSGSVLETGAQQMVDCRLVEVPAYTASAAKSLSDRLVAPLPYPPDRLSTGPCRYLIERYPDALAHAAVIYGDIPASRNRALAQVEACAPLGMRVVYDKPIAIGESEWGPIVSEMRSAGVGYVTIVASINEAIGLLRAMADQGFEPDVVDLGQQYYDPELAAATGAEGALVLTNGVPFEEVRQSPALTAYLRELAEVTSDPPTALGLQAFSAGMLFAEAMASLGDDVSREGLLAALGDIHEWDGGGLHFPTDPGAGAPSECFLYVRVEGRRFVREHPDEGFACDPSWPVQLQGDYGTGATVGATP